MRLSIKETCKVERLATDGLVMENGLEKLEELMDMEKALILMAPLTLL